MNDPLILGFVAGALVMCVGVFIGYEVGRAARTSKPLISLKKKKTQEEPVKRGYMDTKL